MRLIAPTAKTKTSNHAKVHRALKDEVELNDFLEPNQAVTLQEIDSYAAKNTDNLLNLLTKNVRNCKYFDVDQNQITINEKNFLGNFTFDPFLTKKVFDLIFCIES